MDKFPLVLNGKPLGELTAERESLDTWFAVRCRLPGDGLWCAWAVGDRGVLRLGVLESVGDRACLRRKFSDRMTAPVGRLIRGELRPLCLPRNSGEWERVQEPEQLFHTPWLREQLRGRNSVLKRSQNGKILIAIAYDKEKAFPMEQLFCFAKMEMLQQRAYLVFAFDEKERPAFPMAKQENGGNRKK